MDNRLVTQIRDECGGDAERVRGAHVDVAYFDVLGVRAAIGRTFTDIATDSDGVVISHGLWQRQFGGDSGVVGRTILLNGEPRVIIGVLPRTVRVTYPLDTDAYTLRPAGPCSVR